MKAQAARAAVCPITNGRQGTEEKRKDCGGESGQDQTETFTLPPERLAAGPARASCRAVHVVREEGRDRDIPQEDDAGGDAHAGSRLGARRRGRGELEAVLEGAPAGDAG